MQTNLDEYRNEPDDARTHRLAMDLRVIGRSARLQLCRAVGRGDIRLTRLTLRCEHLPASFSLNEGTARFRDCHFDCDTVALVIDAEHWLRSHCSFGARITITDDKRLELQDAEGSHAWELTSRIDDRQTNAVFLRESRGARGTGVQGKGLASTCQLLIDCDLPCDENTGQCDLRPWLRRALASVLAEFGWRLPTLPDACIEGRLSDGRLYLSATSEGRMNST